MSSSSSTPSTPSAPSALSVAGWIIGSVGSSVGLILVNKVIMKSFGFSFVLTLTAMHFLVTALGMEVMALLGFFTRARLPAVDSVLMAVFCIGSVAFMNFSLSYNSVGFYQVTKLLCIPAMVAIQSYFYQQQFSAKVKLALVVVLGGVAAATVSDVELNTVGCMMGAAAVLFTAQFQIWQGDKQRVHKMNAMQMNHAQALPSFLFCLALSLLVDHRGDGPENNVRLHAMQSGEMAWIGLSCVLALSVNLCTYGLIGKTSAVTYQVVGHAKVRQQPAKPSSQQITRKSLTVHRPSTNTLFTCACWSPDVSLTGIVSACLYCTGSLIVWFVACQTCLILMGGFVFFPPSTPPDTSALLKNVGGIIVALIGVVVYSQLKIAESSPTSQPDWCDAMLPAAFLSWAERQFGSGTEDKAAGQQYTLVKMEEGATGSTTDGSNANAAANK